MTFSYQGPATLNEPGGARANATVSLSERTEEVDRFYDNGQVRTVTDRRWGGPAQMLTGESLPLTIGGQWTITLADGRVGRVSLNGWRGQSEEPFLTFELVGLGAPPSVPATQEGPGV